MYLIRLLTTFTGRISRKSWWIGLVIIAALGVAVVLVEFALNPSMFDDEKLPPPTLRELIAMLVLFWPSMAITFKRLQDRDWPDWLGYAVAALFLPWYVGPFFGVFADFEMMATSTPGLSSIQGFEALYFWIALAAGLLLLIDNGFMRGSRGPNRHGEDPLALQA